MTVTNQVPAETESPSVTTVILDSTAGESATVDLYTPSGSVQPEWGIVVAPGYGSIKELMKGWALHLAALGHTVCVVGYRGFGQQPGQLGRIFPEEHVEDVRSAVRWLGNSEKTNPERIAVLGVSNGAGVAVQASEAEEAVEAVVSVVGYGSGERFLRSRRTDDQWDDLLRTIRADRAARMSGGSSVSITLDEVLQRDDEGREWRSKVESEHPTMRFDITIESVEKLLEFRPEEVLPFSRRLPILIIHAERDQIVSSSEASRLLERAGEPKQMVVLKGAEHHQVHTGRAFETCITEMNIFLRGLSIDKVRGGHRN